MTDPNPAQATGLTIPEEIQAKFGELVGLIKESESMNDEERQYWINLLPVMTAEQIQNLRDILENEKKQLAAIDAKYSAEMEKAGAAQSISKMDQERKMKKAERGSAEAKARQEENPDDILKQIES